MLPSRTAAFAFAAIWSSSLLSLSSVAAAATDDAVAVIGAGIAGTTTVLSLLLRGYSNVTLYESSSDFLSSTSSVIAGTVNFDTHYRFLKTNGLDLEDALGWIAEGRVGPWNEAERFANFVKNVGREASGRGGRTSDVQKRRVYRRSYQRLRAVVGAYPRLCEAMIGDWCCRAGEEARGYLEGATGIVCPDDDDQAGDGRGSPFGRFELLSSKCDEVRRSASLPLSGCDDDSHADQVTCEANGHGYQYGVEYEYYDANETRSRVGDFLLGGDGGGEDGIKCSVACHRLTGYVRTEALFEVLAEIMDASPSVNVRLGCLVTELEALEGGRINVSSTCGDANGGNDDADGTDDSANSTAGTGSSTTTTAAFDKVIVAASTASVPLLATIDPNLGENLLGFRGHGVQGGTPGDGTPTISQEQLGRSVHFVSASAEGKAAYARATSDGSVKIWGGLYPDPTDDDVRPPYTPPTDLFALELFVDPPAPKLASAAYRSRSDGRTAVQTGVRPVPSVGNVPLIKRYEGEWTNLYLNTGYGFNGYDLAWFASDCVVSWLDSDGLSDEGCRTATTLGAEKSGTLPLWAIITIAVVATLAVCCCCFLCYRSVRGKEA